MKSRRWLWGFALLPLTCLPLIAQEAGQQDTPTQTPGQTPAQTQAPAADTSRAQEASDPDAGEESAPPDEHVSADNNLSFPVDI